MTEEQHTQLDCMNEQEKFFMLKRKDNQMKRIKRIIDEGIMLKGLKIDDVEKLQREVLYLEHIVKKFDGSPCDV